MNLFLKKICFLEKERATALFFEGVGSRPWLHLEGVLSASLIFFFSCLSCLSHFIQGLRTQNKYEKHSPGLAVNKTVNDHSCSWWPGFPGMKSFSSFHAVSQVEAPFLLLFVTSGLAMHPVARVPQASAARGGDGVPVTAATHTSEALVFTGSPGRPATAESPLGISENAQGCPTGATNKTVPLCGSPVLSPLRCQAPGCSLWRAWRHMPAPLHVAPWSGAAPSVES